jgi:hypothetical protein
VLVLFVVTTFLQLGRIPEDVLAVITGRLLQGLVFMHAKHMVSRAAHMCNCFTAACRACVFACVYAPERSQHMPCSGCRAWLVNCFDFGRVV